MVVTGFSMDADRILPSESATLRCASNVQRQPRHHAGPVDLGATVNDAVWYRIVDDALPQLAADRSRSGASSLSATPGLGHPEVEWDWPRNGYRSGASCVTPGGK